MRLIKILLLITIFSLDPVGVYAPSKPEIEKRNIEIFSNLLKEEELKLHREKEFERFLHDLGKRESGNNPEVYNSLGYIGKYQFGKAARISTGYGHVKYLKFRNNPSIWPEHEQDEAMRRLLMKNQLHLTNQIIMFDGKTRKGRVITKSGILAAAHLSGAGNVKRYFSTNGRYNPKDVYGTSLEDYLFRFSGYEF